MLGIRYDAVRIVAIFHNRIFVELVHKRSKQAKTTRYGDKVYRLSAKYVFPLQY